MESKTVSPSPAAKGSNPGMAADYNTWLPTIGWFFLTVNSITSIHRSINDPWAVAFVVAAYVNVVLLFVCARAVQRAPEKRTLKAAVWALASLLTVLFSCRAAAVMPLFLAVIVWAMAAATVGFGFYVLVVHHDSGAGEKKVPEIHDVA